MSSLNNATKIKNTIPKNTQPKNNKISYIERKFEIRNKYNFLKLNVSLGLNLKLKILTNVEKIKTKII